MSIPVHNINGTGDNKCSCESWLKHWENFKTEATLFDYCSNVSCVKKAEVGAHVQKENVKSAAWFIIPLCDSCNKTYRNKSINVFNKTIFVPANQSETCGK